MVTESSYEHVVALGGKKTFKPMHLVTWTLKGLNWHILPSFYVNYFVIVVRFSFTFTFTYS